MHQTLNLPGEAPLMVLPNAVLFPHALLPLHIFEERYRKMLAHCLERDRLFCIALMKPGISEPASIADFFHVGGLGLIRACVGNADGTSHLVLQGLARVELLGLVAERPFRVAQIRQIRSAAGQQVEEEALSAKVIEMCQTLKTHGMEMPGKVGKELPYLNNPDAVADIVAHSFVADPIERQMLLSESSVAERLRMLIASFQRALDDPAPE